jgi:hypothetical protein
MRRMMLGACNDSLLFPCCVKALAGDLAPIQPGSNGAFGLAVVNEREILMRKRPVAADFDPTGILGDLHTNLFVTLHEGPLAGEFVAALSQPVRYRNWVFCLTGELPDALADPKGAVLEDLPSFLRSVAAGRAYASIIFAWALGVAYRSGLLSGGPEMSVRATGALSEAIEELKTRTGLGALPFSFTLVNGSYALGYVGEAGMQSLKLEAIERCQRCADPLSPRRCTPHEHIHMQLLASVPEELPPPWSRMEPGQCFLLRPDGSLETAAP